MQFRTYLQNEFVRRCENNRAYSLRAYAVNLEINHSSLSRLLNGKRELSTKMVEKLGDKLGLSPEQIEVFKGNQKYEQHSDKIKALQISTDQFKYVSEWYYPAFIELLKTEGPDKTLAHYSKKLGIRSTVLRDALDTLLRLKFLMIDEHQNIVDLTCGATSSCSFNFTTEAKKKYQKQVFKKATEAIDNYNVEQRSHSGMTMAINSNKLSEAKLRIANFRAELCVFLQEGKLDQVYHLSVGLFPLTVKGKKEEENE